ncbi:hypothetical protein THRCLA_05937 [Thraustotheca clavata]|uniref:PHD-type domain-containing protein n=1 Tax=Thraustotheca clavata TaxID=74557 RepID=A0A1V9ZR96_9STRA|nr:hypothetical protein THRCLA_05937 [Thraustotheca clavata]
MASVDIAMNSSMNDKVFPKAFVSSASNRRYFKVKGKEHKQTLKVMYPSRLLVDFKALQLDALHKYVAFYQIPVREEYTKDDLASLVARHFDCSLEVEEDESILSFVARVRNGEKASRTQRSAADRKAKAEAAAAKEARRAAQQSAKLAASANVGSKRPRQEESEVVEEPEKESRDVAPPSKAKYKGKSKKEEDNELYCVCNLPSYGNMIACDGDKCPSSAQWYHLECVGISDGQQPDTWLCPECDPKAFAAVLKKKKKARKMQQQSGSSNSRR